MSRSSERRETWVPDGIDRKELSEIPFMVILHFITREIPMIDLSTRIRKRKNIEMQQLLCYFMSLKELTWKAIGIMIGKDHATSMHGRDNIESLIIFDPPFREFAVSMMKEMIMFHHKMKKDASKKTDLSDGCHPPVSCVDRAVFAQS